jgi:hypothetical protein
MNGTISYQVYLSYIAEWKTIQEIRSNSTLNKDFTQNLSIINLTNLEPYQFYRMDIIAKDSANSELLFSPICFLMDANQTGTIDCKSGLSGNVSTFAGDGTIGSTDSSLLNSRFHNPQGLTYLNGFLYIADTSNHTIRRIQLSTNIISTIAGLAGNSGYVNATGSSARFNNPTGITNDGTSIYISDRGNHAIRKLDISTMNVSTFAGATTVTSGNSDGLGTSARFNSPNYIIFNGTDFYVSDEDNCLIRRISVSANVVRHSGISGTCTNVNTNLLNSTFSADLVSIGFAKDFLLVTDLGNNNIRKVDTNLSGNTSNFLNITNPYATVIKGNQLYLTENATHRILRYNINQISDTEVIAGSGITGSADGLRTSASFNTPRSMIFIGNTLYISDTYNHKIRKVE